MLSKSIFISKLALLAGLTIILAGCFGNNYPEVHPPYKGKVNGKEFTDIYCKPKSTPSVNKPKKSNSNYVSEMHECKR